MPAGTIVSTHYEVVDADDQTVGCMKHKEHRQACDLRRALVAAGHNQPLAIARVVERVVVQRVVERLPEQP